MRRDTQPIPELGQRLRDRRRQLGMSLSDVETYLGIRASKLSGYENGRATPSLHSFIALCHCYNIAPNALLAWSEEAQQKLDGSSRAATEAGWIEQSHSGRRLMSMNRILQVSGRRR